MSDTPNTEELIARLRKAACAMDVNMDWPVMEEAATELARLRAERVPALEFAEYMAKGAEQLLEALNAEDAARIHIDDGDFDNDEERSLKDDLERRIETRCEFVTGLRSDIYEFRKRVPAPPPPAQPAPTRSQKLAEAGFARRPSLWAMQARETLELIAAPIRRDGTWNRDRAACQQLAAEALGRYGDDQAQPAPPSAVERDAVRLNWLMRHVPGRALRPLIGVMAWSGDIDEFRAAIDAASGKENT